MVDYYGYCSNDSRGKSKQENNDESIPHIPEPDESAGLGQESVIELVCSHTQNLRFLATSTPLLSPPVADFLLDIQMIDPDGKLDPL
jgi:hypothetical protein